MAFPFKIYNVAGDADYSSRFENRDNAREGTLTGKINLQSCVDGDHIIIQGDDAGVIGVPAPTDGNSGMLVDKLIQIIIAGNKG